MILIDSSVWIDILAERTTRQTSAYFALNAQAQPMAIGDLMLVEVLQGIRHQRDYRAAAEHFALFAPLRISDHRVASAAASNYRALRARGITIRKTIDTLIATRCILDSIPLLYSDRDYDPFVEHLGLKSAIDLVALG